MKNQYVGDIGDYGKLGLLRQLKGFKLGVNWYLTPKDNKLDGKHTSYESKQDPELYDALQQLVSTGNRNVSALKQCNLLPNAVYYDKMLDFSKSNMTRTSKNMQKYRVDWHNDALERLKGCDLVFLDPDNSFITDAKKPHTKDGHKFVTYDEVEDYYKIGASVIIYSHRDRSNINSYKNRLTKIKEKNYLSNCELVCLFTRMMQQRDYLFVIQPKHYETIKQNIQDIVNKSWKDFFEIRDLQI